MKYKHYSPNAKVVYIDSENHYEIICKLVDKDSGVLTTSKHNYNVKQIHLGSTYKQVSKNLFSAFREMDSNYVKTIYVEPLGKAVSWDGVKNRLFKAVTKVINKV